MGGTEPYKIDVVCMICDGTADTQGDSVTPQRVKLPDGKILVSFFADTTMPPAGTAKLRWNGVNIIAELELYKKLKIPMYPFICAYGNGSECIYEIRELGLTNHGNADQRIEPILPSAFD